MLHKLVHKVPELQWEKGSGMYVHSVQSPAVHLGPSVLEAVAAFLPSASHLQPPHLRTHKFKDFIVKLLLALSVLAVHSFYRRKLDGS